MEEPLKILRFSAQNIKGIRVVEITPEGNVVTISGPNGAGKSTVLDSIERTLCGGQLALSQGAEKGGVEIDMREYTIQRIITKKTDRLIVKNKEGAQYPSPRTFLEKFVGPLSIDPLAFIRLKDREQLDVIFRLNPDLKSALEEADASIEGLREERSEILKETKRLDVDLERVPFTDNTPEEPVSVVDLTNELNEAMLHNRQIETAKGNWSEAQGRLARDEVDLQQYREELAELKAQVSEMKQTIGTLEQNIDEKQQALQKAKENIDAVVPADTSEITKRIAESEAVNERVRHNQEHLRLKAKRIETASRYNEKGHELKTAEEAKASLLADAKMPIEGLSVNGQGVTYHGVPMSEISTSEKVRVGASIAVAQNPKARIILVDDVSLLDSKNLATLHETLTGFQVWQVVNDETGKQGIFIEEGTRKERGENP